MNPTGTIFSGSFTIFGVPINLPALTVDHAEALLGVYIAWAGNHLGLSTAQVCTLNAALGWWFMDFCNDGPGLVTKGLTYLRGLAAKVPTPPASLPMIVLCALFLGTSGCASITTGKSAVTGDTTVTLGNTTVDLGTLAAKTASAAQLAVQNAVPVALAKNPSLRPDLVAAGQALTVALGNGTTDISTLESLINAKISAGNRSAVDEGMAGVVAIYEAFVIAYGSDLPAQEFIKYAAEILTAINNGLTAGLAASPAPAT